MAFINEKLSDEDKLKISSDINFEKISAIAQYIPKFRVSFKWTVDRERNAYLIFLSGGGREQLPYYALGIEGKVVVFNVKSKGRGGDADGIHEHKVIHDLRIPLALAPRTEEIKQLIREGLEENAYFRPLADGGTFDNPNTVARGNILSFNVEFQ